MESRISREVFNEFDNRVKETLIELKKEAAKLEIELHEVFYITAMNIAVGIRAATGSDEDTHGFFEMAVKAAINAYDDMKRQLAEEFVKE